MINNDISQKIANIYKLRKDKAYFDQKNRFNLAVKNKEFADLYTKKRHLESEIAKYKSLHQDYKSLESELESITSQYNKYLKDNNIDLSFHYVCPICQDTGYINNHECKCLVKERISLLKKACSLSPMPNYSFSDNKMKIIKVKQQDLMIKLFKLMEEFCNKFETAKLKTIYLGGEVGVGKTFLASCIANALLDKGIDVNYVTAFDFFRIIQAKQFNSDKDLLTFYPTLFNSKMLIIDDIGSEPIFKNLSLEYMLSIIDYRTSHNYTTMLISNLSQIRFIERYGERIFSRISDPTNSMVQFIKGDDLRKIKHN